MAIRRKAITDATAYRRPLGYCSPGTYNWPTHIPTRNPAPDAALQIRARYLPKEKRWLVLVDSENPFVTEHASLAEAMRLAGAMVDPSGN